MTMTSSSSRQGEGEGEQTAHQTTTTPTPTPTIAHYYDDYDAGDAVILHGLIRATHLNGRKAIVHRRASLPEDGGAHQDTPAGAAAQAQDPTAANGDANANGANHPPAANNGNNTRCLVRLLPVSSRTDSGNGGDSNGGGSRTGTGGLNDEGRCTIAVLPKNMTLDYPAGQRVMLRNLVGAKEYNGRTATVVSFLSRSGMRRSSGSGGGGGGGRFLVEVPIVEEEEGEEGDAKGLDARADTDARAGAGSDASADKKEEDQDDDAVIAQDLKKQRLSQDDDDDDDYDDDDDEEEGSNTSTASTVEEASRDNNDNMDVSASTIPATSEEATAATTTTNTPKSQPKKVKQMLVHPKNILHVPGTRPPPVRALDQRLIFTGPMSSIVRILNQSVHKTTEDNRSFSHSPRQGYGLLSDVRSELRDGEDGNSSTPRALAKMAAAARLWGTISHRSYKSSRRPSASEPESSEDQDQNQERCTTQPRSPPPFYQRLLPPSSLHNTGRTHRVCFNPQCYKHVSPHDGPTPESSKMKRCAKCRSVAYCNRHCALEDWDRHKKVCRIMQSDDVRFADYVALTSPDREEVTKAQRMVRLCVNRIARLEEPSEHFDRMTEAAAKSAVGTVSASGCGDGANDDVDHDDQKGNRHRCNDDSSIAKLLCDVVTQGGTDVTNEILRHLEHPPPPNREVTIVVGFNSLGDDPVYSPKDIQTFANIYDCRVTYKVLKKSADDDGGEEEDDVVVALEPNGEEIQIPTVSFGNGQLPDDVQEGLLNFINNLVPGMMPQQGMNGADGGAGAAENGNADGGGNDNGVDGGGDDNNNNDNNGAAAAGAEGGGGGGGAGGVGGQQMPPGLANFLQHVVNNAGVGGGGADHANVDVNDIAGDNGDGGDGDENGPAGENGGGEGNEGGEQQPQGAGAGAGAGGGAFPFPMPGIPVNGMNGGGGFHFDIPAAGLQGGGGMMGGAHVEAHVHVVDATGHGHGDGNGGMPAGMPMPPPGAFLQVPGMPEGIQAAVMHAGPFPMPPGVNEGNDDDDDNGNGNGNDGMPAGMPLPGPFQQIPGLPEGVHVVHAGPFPMQPQDGEGDGNGDMPEGFQAAMMQAGAFAMPPHIAENMIGEDEEVEEETEMKIEE